MDQHTRTIGKYEILGELGHGAMGVVYQARDPLLDRMVALKTMYGSTNLDPESKERFFREARSAARLQHPNIITVFELGEFESSPYIAMEYLEGDNLEDAVASGRCASLEAKIDVVLQLCRGLSYAHDRGVVHRDIKPSNVFVLPEGTVKVLDFGIARLEGGTFATQTGVLLGTPMYMAPEQFSDEDVDHRVDLWATGVILYELLTGRRPFESTSVPTLIYRIVHTDVPRPEISDRLPAALAQVLMKALAKDPSDRFPDLRSLETALRQALNALAGAGGSGIERAPTTPLTFPADDQDTVETGRVTPHTQPMPPAPLEAARDIARTLDPGAFEERGVFGESAPMRVVEVTPDESVAAVGGVDGSIRLWNLDTRMKILTLRSRMHLRTGHGALTSALTFNLDGSLMASGHLDGSIYIWETATGLELETKLRHEGGVHGLEFSPDGLLLVSTGAEPTLKLWDFPAVAAGEARRQMRRQPAPCSVMVMRPDGSSVITGHTNRAIRIHDLESGRMIATLHGHASVPSAMAVSASGDLLASGSRNGGIRLFRIDSRAMLRHYHGHQKNVTSIAFMPDNRHFASVAMDHGLCVWDIAADEAVTTLWGAVSESFASVVYLPRRRWLLCGLNDGRLRVWQDVSA